MFSVQYDSSNHAKMNITCFRVDACNNNIYDAMKLGTKTHSIGDSNDDVSSLIFDSEGQEKSLAGILQLDVPEAASERGGELYLLPGSRIIVDIEYFLQEGTRVPKQNMYHALAFRAILNKFKEEKDLDLILVDCSPSSSTLNEVLQICNLLSILCVI